jgi:predicted TIM-barrel enzyme
MSGSSSRVRHWREKRRQGHLLLASAFASEAQAKAILPLAPDLLVYHPAFPSESLDGDSGMLSALAFSGHANEEASRGFGAMLPLCAPCPVAMGVCGIDPFLLRETSFSEWREAGLEGLANFPTIGLVDGFFRADLEAARLGFNQETEALSLAADKGFFTIGFACRPDDAALLSHAGCDVLILHLGLTENSGPVALSDNRQMTKYQDAVKGKGATNPLLLLHADHVNSPEDEAAWRDLTRAGSGYDGLFVAGGAARAKTLQNLLSTTPL